MPDDKKFDAPVQAAPAPEQEAAAQAVVLPDTPAQRHEKRMEAAAKETDQQRSERRAAELKRHLDAHNENIAGIHAAYPAVMFTRGMPEIESLSDKAVEDQMRAWNARRHQIDMANKAYTNAVRTSYAEHKAEDVHIRGVRAAAAKNAA